MTTLNFNLTSQTKPLADELYRRGVHYSNPTREFVIMLFSGQPEIPVTPRILQWLKAVDLRSTAKAVTLVEKKYLWKANDHWDEVEELKGDLSGLTELITAIEEGKCYG